MLPSQLPFQAGSVVIIILDMFPRAEQDVIVDSAVVSTYPIKGRTLGCCAPAHHESMISNLLFDKYWCMIALPSGTTLSTSACVSYMQAKVTCSNPITF